MHRLQNASSNPSRRILTTDRRRNLHQAAPAAPAAPPPAAAGLPGSSIGVPSVHQITSIHHTSTEELLKITAAAQMQINREQQLLQDQQLFPYPPAAPAPPPPHQQHLALSTVQQSNGQSAFKILNQSAYATLSAQHEPWKSYVQGLRQDAHRHRQKRQRSQENNHEGEHAGQKSPKFSISSAAMASIEQTPSEAMQTSRNQPKIANWPPSGPLAAATPLNQKVIGTTFIQSPLYMPVLSTVTNASLGIGFDGSTDMPILQKMTTRDVPSSSSSSSSDVSSSSENENKQRKIIRTITDKREMAAVKAEDRVDMYEELLDSCRKEKARQAMADADQANQSASSSSRTSETVQIKVLLDVFMTLVILDEMKNPDDETN